jgi:ADP-ribose pyrophosphatase YjhB (NUDIX family)
MEYWQFLRKHIGKERVIMPSSLGAITNNKNEILLVYHKDLKQWAFPGGLQDLNESVEATVKREVLEELNLELEIGFLIGVYSSPKWHHSFSNGDLVQNLSFLFWMNNFPSSGNIQIDKKEISDYNFFDLNHLPFGCSPLTIQQCKDIQEFSGKTFVR